MTNYNERLDEVREIIRNAIKADPNYDEFIDLTGDMGIYDIESRAIADIKQLITSLIKELVAEAKPANVYKTSDGQVPKVLEAPAHAYDVAIQDFEQNLLKALEEV